MGCTAVLFIFTVATCIVATVRDELLECVLRVLFACITQWDALRIQKQQHEINVKNLMDIYSTQKYKKKHIHK